MQLMVHQAKRRVLSSNPGKRVNIRSIIPLGKNQEWKAATVIEWKEKARYLLFKLTDIK